MEASAFEQAASFSQATCPFRYNCGDLFVPTKAQVQHYCYNDLQSLSSDKYLDAYMYTNILICLKCNAIHRVVVGITETLQISHT